MIHGFNGTSRLWRMPAAAIRRGSVVEISGAGVAKLAERAAKMEWLGERTHEGFGRFRIDATLPGVTNEAAARDVSASTADVADEAIAAKTQEWCNAAALKKSRWRPELAHSLRYLMRCERSAASPKRR